MNGSSWLRGVDHRGGEVKASSRGIRKGDFSDSELKSLLLGEPAACIPRGGKRARSGLPPEGETGKGAIKRSSLLPQAALNTLPHGEAGVGARRGARSRRPAR
jgi:hypothetical protein